MARRNRTPKSVLTDTAELDVAVCERARVNRDRRYDGLFFSGVRTTGVYCRPVCPVHPARAKNVTFYPSTAAAELDGFRPCLNADQRQRRSRQRGKAHRRQWSGLYG
jgi:AraC family transcriptional regulator, regulatory protein of adaptative response / methylated-DNA-[protein]-cysteine methyltransferase